MKRFAQIYGPVDRLPTNENHLNFKWLNNRCKIFFSITRKGNAASCHFTSDKAGLEYVRDAINDFVDFAFRSFYWCDAILAKVTMDTVRKIIRGCNFQWAATTDDFDLYIRRR